MPTYTNTVNASQFLVETKYKEDFHNQPIISKLTQHELELVIRGRMKQHTANNIKGIITNTHV